MTGVQTCALPICWEDDILLPEELSNRIYIKHLEGPLFFGFVSQFRDLVRTIPTVNYVIIRMKHVPYIDLSGLYALEDSILYLQSKGITVLITGCQPQPLDMLKVISCIPVLVPEKHIFPEFTDCIAWIKKKYDIHD